MNHRKRKKVLVSRMLLTAGCYVVFLHSEPDREALDAYMRRSGFEVGALDGFRIIEDLQR